MAEITIRHTMQDGTILTGSVRGDGVWEIAKAAGFTYRRSVGIFIMGSRDRRPDTWKIGRAKTALEEAGHTVTLDLERELRPPEEREAALAERLEDRQERLADRGDRLTAEGHQRVATARQMGSIIPFGQPMMPDHHSYRSDVAYRKRMANHYQKGFEALDAGEAASDAAEASAANLERRYSGPVIRRRLDKLAADERRWIRDLDGRVEYEQVGDRWRPRLVKPSGRTLSWILRHLAEVQADILFWRGELKKREASGFKVWGPADFAKGDQVLHSHGWDPVLRVNKKSLTVPHGIDGLRAAGHTWTIPYDKVRGRRTREEAEALTRPQPLEEVPTP